MSLVVEITQLLLSAQSNDTNVRTQAERQLEEFQTTNFPAFMASLSSELANSAKPQDSRRLAGLILKTWLDAKEEARRAELHARWVALDPSLKMHIRDALLRTLHSDLADVRHTAALVTAKAAAVDLPRKEWPNLIGDLLANMGVTPPVPGTRQATLEALGYICEEMAARKDEVLTNTEINNILTAVVAGMGPTEPPESRLAATKALCNAIEFAQLNFENDSERNYLMGVVCQGTQSPDEKVRYASFECLHEIANYYYPQLVPYITEIYNITVKAIKEDSQEVALQAIEFWSTVADMELDLSDPGSHDLVCHNFVPQAAPHLTPILLDLLTKQEDDQEQDEATWSVSMAAGTCLGLVAKLVGNNILPLVMPFIQANVSRQTGSPDDWRYREAATYIFGRIMEGPEPSALIELAKAALNFLMNALKDTSEAVRDTTAWTIGRLLEYLHDVAIEPPVITRESLPLMVAMLSESLKDKPRVAYHICGAIGHLATGFKGSQGGTSPMSPFFKDLVGALLQLAARHASLENAKVQIAAFEAINDLVRATSRDTAEIVAQLIQVVLTEIHKTFEGAATTAEAQDRQAEVQGQLCGVLQVVVTKLSDAEDTKALVLPYADTIMETLLRIFLGRSSTVHEEAMLAVGAFSYALGKQFNKYMPQFVQYLEAGLLNYREWQVCLSTVGVLGDICRNVEEDILPYCDGIMSTLIQNLGREDVHQTIKPQILSSFGDIALVIGERFEKYLEAVLRVLKQANQLSMTNTDPDFAEYNNELRRGILDAYCGIVQGLGSVKCEQYLRAEVPSIIDFVASIGADSAADEANVRLAVNLLGDMCSVMSGVGQELRVAPNQQWSALLSACESSSDREETEWAVQQVNAAMHR